MIELGSLQTLIVAILVLYTGKWLNRFIPFLREYNIPEPVTGGILASLAFGVFYFITDTELVFSLADRDTLFLAFFTTLGLSTRARTLIEGGKALAILLVLGICYLFLQNLIGLGVMETAGIEPIIGIIGGSVSLGGGFGHALAWSELFKTEYGVTNAYEIGIACATFGLLLGGVLGGPIAKFLINRYDLKAQCPEDMDESLKSNKLEEGIDYFGVLNSLLVIAIAMGIGIFLDSLLVKIGFTLPTFISCLVTGIVLTNTVPYIHKSIKWPAGTPSLALISNLSLGLFLAISLMSIRIWTLVDLAGPILILLVVQALVLVPFVVLVVFRLLGKDYDAAVLSAGYAGQGLGATPTAFANMAAVTSTFGASPKAFIVIPFIGPLVGGVANAFIIKFFLSFFI